MKLSTPIKACSAIAGDDVSFIRIIAALLLPGWLQRYDLWLRSKTTFFPCRYYTKWTRGRSEESARSFSDPSHRKRGAGPGWIQQRFSLANKRRRGHSRVKTMTSLDIFIPRRMRTPDCQRQADYHCHISQNNLANQTQALSTSVNVLRNRHQIKTHLYYITNLCKITQHLFEMRRNCKSCVGQLGHFATRNVSWLKWCHFIEKKLPCVANILDISTKTTLLYRPSFPPSKQPSSTCLISDVRLVGYAIYSLADAAEE